MADENLQEAKLREELAELRFRNSWFGRYSNVGTLLIAAIGIGITVYQLWDQQRDAIAQREAEAVRGQESRAEDFRQRYWQEQIATYRRAITAASQVSNATRLEEVEAQRREFWNLYWGEMSLIETPEVEQAMIAFGRLLNQWETEGKKPEELQNHAYAIAHCGRLSLQATWNPVNIGQLGTGTDARPRCPY